MSLFSQQVKSNSDYSFTENIGQIVDQDGKENKAVKYLFHSNGLNVQIKNEGFSYDVYEIQKIKKKKSKQKKNEFAAVDKNKPEFDLKYQFHRVDIDFVGANQAPQIVAEGKSEDYDNYYNIPNKPNGVEKVYRYQKITYKNLYPNVDLVFFKPNDTLKPVEYNFIVKPGGKISDIQLKFKGAKTILKDGKLSMNLRFGEMQENIPHSWEEEGNLKKSINIGFKDLGNGVFGFNADEDISDKIVVIDPVPTRIWSTDNSNAGGNLWGGFKVLTGKNNKVYTLDERQAKYLVTTDEYVQYISGVQVYGYISSFDENGTKLWGAYLGNHHVAQDYSNDFRDFNIDSENNLIIIGSARDDNFGNNNITTPGAFQEHSTINNNNFYPITKNDAFIMKLNNSGQKIWGTYYGGNEYDIFNTVEVDSSDNLILSGRTFSTNLISNIIQNVINGKNDGYFISKFSKDGQLLNSYLFPINSSYDGDLYTSIDKNDNVYLATSMVKTFTGNVIGSPNTHQTGIIGSTNAFLLKIDKNFNYIWGTYFGGNNRYGILYNQDGGRTDIKEVTCDELGNIIIAGSTSAIEKIATPGTHMENISNDWVDMYIAKFSIDGKQIWGTYYGDANVNTSGDDNLFCMDVNENNDIFVGGYTVSKNNITTPDGYIPNFDFYNQGFFSKFNSTGNQVWGSYYKRPIISIHSRNNFVYTFTTYDVAKFYDCGRAINYSSNSPICIGKDIILKASGGTNYLWTGPNGFSSAQQNPTVPNATAINAGIYSCVISGTGGCDGTFTVDVKVEDKTAPIPNIANLPTITGNCKTIITTIPTANDNCMGNIIATTTNPLQYTTPGNYIIVWNYDDGNGNISTQNQNIIITSELLPTANPTQNFCKINQPKISNLVVTGTDIKWYDASGNILNTTTLLVDGTKYYATQTLNGCESAKTEIAVTVNDPNPPTGNNLQDFCSAQLPKVSDLVATGQNIRWYDNLGTLIPASTLLLDGKTYYGTQTINSCESTQKIAVTVTINNGGIPANNYTTAFCNDTTATTKNINLHDYKGNLVANPSDYLFDFFDSNNQVVPNPVSVDVAIGINVFNVKVYNSLGCLVFVKLSLTLSPKPILNLLQEDEFCDGQSVDLDAGSGFSSYEWTKDNNPTIIFDRRIFPVSQVGKYTVRVTNVFNCESTASINVTKAVIAAITGVQIVNSTATILLSNSGNFEYSLDNVTWQDSNIFPNLPNGNYTVFVRTKLGCIIGSANFSIFSVSNAFTPDGDGINDTWKIAGLENYPNSEVQVYDRFGNMVLQKIINGTFEWNGSFNARKLPTGNYWYVVKVSDGRLLNGWVLLKNRN